MAARVVVQGGEPQVCCQRCLKKMGVLEHLSYDVRVLGVLFNGFP
jgi:hypothetical protein